MQAEPTKAEPPKRKRRWFQFSLRTLMIGVTLFCMVIGGYVGWQAKIIRERNAMAHRIESIDHGWVEIGRLDQGWVVAGLDPNLYEEIKPRSSLGSTDARRFGCH